jgi:hypothetical protein
MTSALDTMLESSIDIHIAEQAIKLSQLRARWASCRDFYTPVVNALQRIGIEPTLADYVMVSTTGDAARLAKVIRILRCAGFTFSGDRPKAGDTSWNTWFRHPDCHVSIFFCFTSSVCRRVKVGTVMQEVDVYETRCDAGGCIEAPDSYPAEIPF